MTHPTLPRTVQRITCCRCLVRPASYDGHCARCTEETNQRRNAELERARNK